MVIIHFSLLFILFLTFPYDPMEFLLQIIPIIMYHMQINLLIYHMPNYLYKKYTFLANNSGAIYVGVPLNY